MTFDLHREEEEYKLAEIRLAIKRISDKMTEFNTIFETLVNN